jgi:hypothetical protein
VNLRVWKFNLNLERHTRSIQMPGGASVLTAQLQGEFIAMWAMVNPDEPVTIRTFYVCFTGEPIPYDKVEYIATIQHPVGLVYHLWEVLD